MPTTSSWKPMSNMRSASSKTKYETNLSSTTSESAKSMRRPGVPTKRCTPFFKCDCCVHLLPPPYTHATRTAELLKIFWASSEICTANSRVGAKTSAEVVIHDCFRQSDTAAPRLTAKGIRKAKVLPLPVCAKPITSRPMTTNGMACAWIGIGALKPQCHRFCSTICGTPCNSSKEDTGGGQSPKGSSSMEIFNSRRTSSTSPLSAGASVNHSSGSSGGSWGLPMAATDPRQGGDDCPKLVAFTVPRQAGARGAWSFRPG
mmetsp:Transcript_18335/g.36888  ORF Transcript_18335/g.36888 Transcript_18335/m.36888 type:complete len:260 (+) Transcript_18335:919-1698(+)